MPRRATRLALAATTLGALAIFCATSVDDSFITLRYSANFVHGHGPVFNIGQRVEGFT